MTKYDNSGALFKNARKEKDTHPDYEGSITVNGVEYWLKSWLKQGAKGTFMSLSVAPKQERAQEIKQEARGSFRDEVLDDLPF
jgi:hypothetical protein